MIIVEGFDMSGKTTLAGKISERLGWPVLHTGGPTRDEADVVACLVRSRQRMQRKCVQDRVTHVSESVYSMTEFPRKAALALDAIREIPPSVMFIYCKPPPPFLLRAMKDEHVAKAHDTNDLLDRIEREAAEMIAFYDTVVAMVARRVDVIYYNRCQEGDLERVMQLVEERFT